MIWRTNIRNKSNRKALENLKRQKLAKQLGQIYLDLNQIIKDAIDDKVKIIFVEGTDFEKINMKDAVFNLTQQGTF